MDSERFIPHSLEDVRRYRARHAVESDDDIDPWEARYYDEPIDFEK